MEKMLRKYDVEGLPVFSCQSAFARPIRRVVQMVRNLGRPEAGDVAIVDVAFHRLAESCCATGGIDFPSRGEDDGASHGDMDFGRGPAGRLEGNNILLQRLRV